MECESTIVAIARCPTYEPEVLGPEVDRLLSGIAPSSLDSATRVLLKPNLISVRHGTLACSEAAVILAVADWFLERGVHVSLGDSPAFGTAHHALSKLGITDQLHRRGVQILDFKDAVSLQLPSGIRLGIAREAMECDLLVNIPRVKAHGQLLMTMAVKNCFGCVAGMRKPWLHMAHGGSHGHFSAILTELLEVLPPTLSLLDGIVAMSDTGPIQGKPCPLGVLGASMNPVALDTAFYAIVGVDPHRAPLWRACRHAHKKGIREEELVYPLLRPVDVLADNFPVPHRLSPIRFRPWRFLRNSIKRLFSS